MVRVTPKTLLWQRISPQNPDDPGEKSPPVYETQTTGVTPVRVVPRMTIIPLSPKRPLVPMRRNVRGKGLMQLLSV
jgi:hypothetical protein